MTAASDNHRQWAEREAQSHNREPTMIPVYYECGICECIHPWDWDGDCREDANRFDRGDLDLKHGPFQWELRSMEERVEADGHAWRSSARVPGMLRAGLAIALWRR